MKRKIMSLKEYLTKNYDKEMVEAFYRKNETIINDKKGEEIREI